MEQSHLIRQDTKTESRRCAACGGLNPPDAAWCGQCLTRFTTPGSIPSPPPPPPAQLVARPAADVVERGAFKAAGDRITWTCALCEAANPLEASVCSTCGAAFATTVRPKEPKGPIRDPNTAALVSLFFPGAGHAYIGLWGQAVARGIMSLWVAATALVAIVTKGPNSGGLVITFGLASLALWLVGAHDAYREARREQAFVLLQGRRFLWLTLTLLGVMFLTLMMGFMGAQTAEPAGTLP